MESLYFLLKKNLFSFNVGPNSPPGMLTSLGKMVHLKEKRKKINPYIFTICFTAFLHFYLLESLKCDLKILSNCIVEKIPLNLGGIRYGKFIGPVDARLNGGHYFSIGSI
jgi:hypothetical protein